MNALSAFGGIIIIIAILILIFIIYFIFKIIQFVIVAVNLYKKMISRQDAMVKLLLDIRDNTKKYDESNQTYEGIIRKNEIIFLSNVEELLKKINEYFNNKNYEKMREIYVNPDGNRFSDEEWESLTKGLNDWLLQSGKIKTSRIINKSINNIFSSFSLETEYEKAGIIKEELTVIKKGDSYFITFIGQN